jgi:hypothetical protein
MNFRFYLFAILTSSLILLPISVIKLITRYSAKANALEKVKQDLHLFGFFYQVYKQPKATYEVLKSVNRYMPGSPIYMVSSNGYHYDPLARRYSNIYYVYEEQNFDPPQAIGNLTIWFDRVKKAALWCNCSYLIFLEDDVVFRKPLENKPPMHDAGGVPGHLWCYHWADKLPIEEVSNWSYSSYGMCGGSYVKVESFLQAYTNISWKRIEKLSSYWDAIGKFNDVTIAALLMDQGFILHPWDQLTELNTRSYNETAAIAHKNKQFYDKNLTSEDGFICLEQNQSEG